MEIQVAIIYPNDVAHESKAAMEEIRRVSNSTSQYGMTFNPVDWQHAYSSYSDRDPQHDIDPLLSRSHIYIAIFSGKTGREYYDGIPYTVHELDSAILRYKRHKFDEFAPEIVLFFKNDRREIGSSSEQELLDATEVRRLRMSFEKQILVKTFDDVNDLVGQINERLWQYYTMKKGGSNARTSTIDGLFSDLVSEKIITHLEMDMGYSEKIVRIFDKFYLGGLRRCEPYYTNLIFEARRLGGKENKNLYTRFKMFLRTRILDAITTHINSETTITNENFYRFADIVIQEDTSGLQKNDPLYSTHEKHCVENLFADIANDFRPMVYPNGSSPKKALVFVTTIVSDTTILHIQETIKQHQKNGGELPHVFLFSVIETPSQFELDIAIRRDYECSHNEGTECAKKDEQKDDDCRMNRQRYESLNKLLIERKFHYISFFDRERIKKEFCKEKKQPGRTRTKLFPSGYVDYLPEMPDDLYGLAQTLPKRVFRWGYFLFTSKRTSPRWHDLYALSHLFNASKDSAKHREYLECIIRDIVVHQKQHLGINSVIIPRWTCCTEDLFSETLLNACFALSQTDSFRDITIYELFSAGGESGEYYLSPLLEDATRDIAPNTSIKAVAFLALDIHAWVIERLLEANKKNKNFEIPSVFSLVGICNQSMETKGKMNPDIGESEFKKFPLFNVLEDATITYIKDQAFYPYGNSAATGES